MKPTNNHIHAVLGISPGLKSLCIQVSDFSVWSEFQNVHANGPEFIRKSMEVFLCASNICAEEQECEYPQNVCCYLLSSACVLVKGRLAGPISVTQIHILLLEYEVLHPFALVSLCLVLPGLSKRIEGGEGGQLQDFWLLPGLSEPGNVLN